MVGVLNTYSIIRLEGSNVSLIYERYTLLENFLPRFPKVHTEVTNAQRVSALTVARTSPLIALTATTHHLGTPVKHLLEALK